MDSTTAYRLNELNKRFYSENAGSFSETRNSHWPGWGKLLAHAESARSVLDVACGNLRFERYWRDELPQSSCSFYCIDSCPKLAGDVEGVQYIKVDIVEWLLHGQHVNPLISVPQCDLVVCFGFLHHVPGFNLRVQLMKALLDQVKQGGILAVSFWNFMSDSKLAQKARTTTQIAQAQMKLALDDEDYLLGWQDVEEAYRYCHNFEDGEVDALIDAVSDQALVVDRYRSDGRTGALNTYIVLQRM